MKEFLDNAAGYRDSLMVYGLATVPLLAGISKLYNPQLWMGFHVQRLMPIPEIQVLYISGVIEVLAGLLLFSRYKSHIVSAVTAVWLLAITVQVAYKSLWLTALRDLGLTLFALAVALNEYDKK